MVKPTQNARDTINISLTPYLKQMLDECVQTGRYSSVSEVVREALRQWEQSQKEYNQKLAELRAMIQEGIDSGPGRTYNNFEEFISHIKQEAAKRKSA